MEFMVLDEVDRLLLQSYQNWINTVYGSLNFIKEKNIDICDEGNHYKFLLNNNHMTEDITVTSHISDYIPS